MGIPRVRPGDLACQRNEDKAGSGVEALNYSSLAWNGSSHSLSFAHSSTQTSRNREYKNASFPGFRLRIDSPAVPLDDFLAEGKADSGAFVQAQAM